MVPHGVIEEAIRKILGTQDEESMSLIVVGIPDPARGEELIVLTTRDLDWSNLKQQLSEAGLPNLWIPKTAKKVEQIPLLATGKLDLRACQDMAKD
jgi:acyl-[acyl-carrier-protein]-phospholipid O-acyltransferase/long-chain-fatty-acid--[acyl-carrier-protein] ligase